MGGGANRYNNPTASTNSNGFYVPEQRPQMGAATQAVAVTPTDPQAVTFNGSARDTNAAITRAQWADYLKRFQPLEGELQDGLTFDVETGAQNIQLIGQNVGTAVKSATSAFESQEASQARNLERMGITPNGDQQASLSRASAISKAAAQVDAENMTRNRLADRNQEIALGSVTSSGRSY